MSEERPGGPVERIVRRRDDVCESCDVQGRCSSGTKYEWVHGKGRVESPCACACHLSPSKKPPNTALSGAARAAGKDETPGSAST